MIRHVVFVKFKADAAEDAVAEFIREVDRVAEINPEVRNWVSGGSVSPRFHSGDFDWGLTCDLADWDAMDRYMWHEAHLRTMSLSTDVVAYIESFDFEIEFEAPEAEVGDTWSTGAAADDGLVMPDVRGRTREVATRLLAAAGLVVEPEARKILGAPWAPGRVLATRPRPGADVARGSVVSLTVAGEWWSRPDFSALGDD